MSEKFLGQIQELDNNNQATFEPIDTTQHGVKNAYGVVVHTAGLVAKPRVNTPAVIMESDCQSSDSVGITINHFDAHTELNEGDFGIQNPLNSKIRVITAEDKVLIKSGTSTVEILMDGTMSMSIGNTAVANFTQTSIDFLVPVNMPVGSKVNNKLVAVVGGTTTGNASTQTITNAGQ
jgi:hypothetical protein